MNNLQLVGRLTKDPVAREVNGRQVVTCTIAVDRSYVGKEGKRETDFIPFSIWGERGNALLKYKKSGDFISIPKGSIRTSSKTDESGNKQYRLDVIAEEVRFYNVGSKKKNADSSENGSSENSDDGTGESIFDGANFDMPEEFYNETYGGM